MFGIQLTVHRKLPFIPSKETLNLLKEKADPNSMDQNEEFNKGLGEFLQTLHAREAADCLQDKVPPQEHSDGKTRRNPAD